MIIIGSSVNTYLLWIPPHHDQDLLSPLQLICETSYLINLNKGTEQPFYIARTAFGETAQAAAAESNEMRVIAMA